MRTLPILFTVLSIAGCRGAVIAADEPGGPREDRAGRPRPTPEGPSPLTPPAPAPGVCPEDAESETQFTAVGVSPSATSSASCASLGVTTKALLQPLQIGPNGYLDALVGATPTDAIFRTPSGVVAVPLDASAPPTTVFGTPVASYGVRVSGGAVAVWDDTSTLHVWTRTDGLVTMGHAAHLDFVADAAGTRVAYAESYESGSTTVRIRSITDAAISSTLAFDVASPLCPPSMAFVGGAFLGMFCPGASKTANVAELVTVTSSGAVVRLDAPDLDAPPTLMVERPRCAAPTTSGFDFGKSVFDHLEPSSEAPFGFYSDGPSFEPSASGATVFARRADGAGVVLSAAAPPVVLDADVVEGMMLPDGSAVVYRTATNELKRSTTTSPPVVETLATGVKSILGRSPDDARVFVSRKVGEYGRRDLHAVSLTGSPGTTTYVDAAVVSWGGINGTGTHLVFGGSETSAVIDLASGEKKMLPSYATYLEFPRDSAGVLVPPSCPFECTGMAYYDLVTLAGCPLGSSVEEVSLRGGRVVFSNFDDQTAYAVSAP